MDETATPSILWIGRGDHPEFAETRSALGRLAQVVECRTFAQALELDPADDCAIIVVAEALPGEHLAAGYAALRRVRPTVPIARVYGSLCEGELRTNPPPPAMRFSWLNAAAALTADWRRLLRGACPSWGRPAAASEEERLLADTAVESPSPLPLKRVGVFARDPATAAWLGDFLQRYGVTAVRVVHETASEPPAVDAILWDRPLSEALRETEQAMLRRAYPNAPLVVLTNFPRVDEVRRLREQGAAAVLAKPLVLQELEDVLRVVVDRVA